VAKPQKSCPLQTIGPYSLMAVGLVGALLAPSAKAQAITEAGSSSSLSSSVAANAKPMDVPKSLPSAASGTSPHVQAPVNSPAALVEANRRALEIKAGRDASRLLIISYPSQAQVWIDEKPVGTTPLLLIVPPGKYKIELRGPREESAKQEVALLPKEIREVVVKLGLRYPTHVISRSNR